MLMKMDTGHLQWHKSNIISHYTVYQLACPSPTGITWCLFFLGFSVVEVVKGQSVFFLIDNKSSQKNKANHLLISRTGIVRDLLWCAKPIKRHQWTAGWHFPSLSWTGVYFASVPQTTFRCSKNSKVNQMCINPRLEILPECVVSPSFS